MLRHVQNGSYGDVFSMRDKQTGFTCAAKRVRFLDSSFLECDWKINHFRVMNSNLVLIFLCVLFSHIIQSNLPSADSSKQFQLGGSGDLEQVGLTARPSALRGCTRGPQRHSLHGP